MASWILLRKRSLFYSQCNSKLKEIDLRKARCIGKLIIYKMDVEDIYYINIF